MLMFGYLMFLRIIGGLCNFQGKLLGIGKVIQLVCIINIILFMEVLMIVKR